MRVEEDEREGEDERMRKRDWEKIEGLIGVAGFAAQALLHPL